MSDHCWVCDERPPEEQCGGWGCSSGGMPVMKAAELMALTRPRVCIGCEQRPALIGKGSNYCEVCRPPYSKSASQEEDEADESEADRRANNGGYAGDDLHRGWPGCRLTDYDPPEGL